MKNLMKITAAIALALAIGLSLAACDGSAAQPTAAAKTRAAAESNQNSLLADTPVPILTHSEERQNLIDRANILNQRNMTGCISLYQAGRLIATIMTDGKVSSLNSYLLPSDQIWKDWNTYGYAALTQEAPDIDGAYGENVAGGIFFFTAETHSYVEWRDAYLFTDQCLSFQGEPIEVKQVK